MKYKDLCTSMSVGLGIPKIRSDLNELSNKLIGKASKSTKGMPYVISSIYQSDVKEISEYGEYHLSVGMQDAFNKV